jgi:aminomethyltransferase
MRISPLHDFFATAGARFEERYGVETVNAVTDRETEHSRVRDSVALSDASYMQVFRIPEENAIDALDPLLAGNIARIRFGRLLHTFLADPDGHLAADCYVANNDDEFLVVCESLLDDNALRSLFMEHGGQAVGMEDWSDTHAVLSIDGYQAWAVAREVFGSDILGLPYLSIETCAFEGEPVRLFRAGKTSEFGYLALIPNGKAEALAAALLEVAETQGGGLCGSAIQNELRLEGRFFNIYAEGATVRDPLSLGLQWMIDLEKPDFRGGPAIRQRREAGLTHKIIGIQAAPGQSLDLKTPLLDGDTEVGEVVAACTSDVLGCQVGLALLKENCAYSGLTLQLNTANRPDISTISMPPIMPRSLSVKLDEV